MHVFLDAMNRRDWVFTLHAIKPCFTHCHCLHVCSQVRNMSHASDNCRDSYFACSNAAVWKNHWNIWCAIFSVSRIAASLERTFKVIAKGSFTYTRCDDAAMHVFLDAMNRRDWVFTLHAIKPFCFFSTLSLSVLYVCSQVRNMSYANDNCRDNCFACSNAAVWTNH